MMTDFGLVSEITGHVDETSGHVHPKSSVFCWLFSIQPGTSRPRCPGAAAGTTPDHDLGFEQRLGLLVDRAVLHRENRRLGRLLSQARLRVSDCIEDIDYAHPRGLEKSRVASLSSMEWIVAHRNLCITGPTGCGKTWLSFAFGNQVCRQGYSVRYLRLPRLLEQLRIAHGDGSYARLMNQLLKTDLLILADWGMQSLTGTHRQDMMEVIEDRHGRRSTLIASQLPIDHWHEFIGEAALADAILDRLLHSAHRLLLKGESLRKSQSPLTDGDRAK